MTHQWLQIPWADMLLPQRPVEMFLRGTLAYLGLLAILRVVLKRQAGNIAFSDVLVTVLIADAIQNGMAGEYKSVTDGLILVSTIVWWDYFVDWISYHSKLVDRFLTPPPVALIRDGKLLRRNMRRELVSEPELMAKLRMNGLERIADVKRACLEHDGEISVVKK